VAAYLDGQSTLKTFIIENGKPYLRAENPKYRDIIPAEDLTIQGVLRSSIRKTDYWHGQPKSKPV
jgi:repressor LexA